MLEHEDFLRKALDPVFISLAWVLVVYASGCV